MKRKLLVLLACCVSLDAAAQVFWSDNFEDTGSPSVGSRTTSVAEFRCGSGFFKRTDGSDKTWMGFPSGTGDFTGYANGKYFAAMDVDRGPACGGHNTISAAQSITWSGINIAGRTSLSFRGLFGANSGASFQGVYFNNAGENFAMDYIVVEYRLNGTGGWTKVLGIYPNGITATGGAMAVDTNNDLVGDGTVLSNAMAELSADITATGTTLDLRVSLFVNNTSPGVVAFDNFRLSSAAVNTAPVAASVTHTGSLREGQTLTGSYSYSDAESNAESGSTFKWYRSDNGAGLNKAAIASATSNTYLLAMADIGKYISFEVTPRDGSLNGTPVESPLRGPVLANVLPVGFLGLSARVEGAGVRLDWHTASETDNKGFAVWRGDGAGVWKVLGEVAGKGMAGVGAAYSFVDRAPLSGDNYYRLVQVDVDGRESELETKVLGFSLAGNGVTVYPNPVTDKVTVAFEVGKYSAAKLLGPDGKTIKTWTLSKNATLLSTSLHGLPKGVYLVGLRSSAGWTYEKLIKN